MTRDEAKTRLIALKAEFELLCALSGMEMSEVFDVAIKALVDNDIKEHLIADIKSYECDCRRSQDDDLICKRCNDNLFQSIYKIIERNFENDKGITL